MEIYRAAKTIDAAIAQTPPGDPARQALEATRLQLRAELGKRLKKYGLSAGGGLLAIYAVKWLLAGR